MNYVQYFVVDGNDMIIPKSVRPIIDYEETFLGEKKGANRQFRFGNLHIREYNEYYTIHRDKIDPRKDPFGHLLVDAPEYLAAILSAVFVGSQVGSIIYNDNKNNDKNERFALNNTIIAGCFAGSIAGSISYITSNIVKRIIKRTECIESS
ncbi:MAG: hypothetical protein ACJ71I_03295 [Nitrososphaeraceae archaeon]